MVDFSLLDAIVNAGWVYCIMGVVVHDGKGRKSQVLVTLSVLGSPRGGRVL